MPSTISGIFDDSPGEFITSVEVFITNSTSAALPKLSTKSRKLEKRESVGDDLKVKDKVSSTESFAHWGLSATGRWRAAICRLTEDKERCILNIYIDESILHETIFIHLINQTDIRPTEQSLFYRKDCISISPRNNGQHRTSSQPTHLAFPSPDVCATWQALLKSYAIPETYGRYLVPTEGGFYRLWRQVELTVIQGRNLGPLKNETAGNSEERSEIDAACEVYVNDTLCARTTVKKGSEFTDWHEQFSFPGLPPFGNLKIVVWKDRKLSKPIHLGSTCIVLRNFRRGEFVEGWFPVVRSVEALGVENRVGDLRLKIRVDEEVILPNACYAGLMTSCQSRNFLDWILDLESRLDLKDISTQLMPIAIANNTIVQQMQEYIVREVESSPTSHQTLFRGNTKLTKVVELSMAWYGMSFLEASIGPTLRRLCSEKVAIEIAPRSGKGQKEVEKNAEQLVYWCQEFWNQIYSVRAECPNEIKHILKSIRTVVEQRYRADTISGDGQGNLPRQCVSAFIFLRFIVAAILHPHLFGLYPGVSNFPANIHNVDLQIGLLSLPVQRSLTLVAKVIQSLANLNLASHKENLMRGVQEFLKNSFHGMIDYISVVSTPVEGIPIGNDDRSRHIRKVTSDLRQRSRTMATLNRESIPTLPHLLDIPRHLACVSSAVIRNSKESTRARRDDAVDKAIDDFCARCFEVEEEAFSRVNRIVTMVRSAFTEETQFSFPPKIYDRVSTSSPVRETPVIPSDGQGRTRLDSRSATTLTGFESHRQKSNNEQEEYTDKEGTVMEFEGLSTESLPRMVRETRTPASPPPTTPIEKEQETGKRKKGLFRSILKR